MLRGARATVESEAGPRRWASSADGDFPATKQKTSAGRTRVIPRFRSVDAYLGRKQFAPTQEEIYALIQSPEGETVGKTLSPYRPLPSIGDRVPTPMPLPAGDAASPRAGGRGAWLGTRRLRPPSPSPPPTPPPHPRLPPPGDWERRRTMAAAGVRISLPGPEETVLRSVPQSPRRSPLHGSLPNSAAVAPAASQLQVPLQRQRTYNVLEPRVLRRTFSESESSSSSATAGTTTAAAAEAMHHRRRKKRSRRRDAPPPPSKRAPEGLNNTLLFGPRLNHNAPVVTAGAAATSTGLFSSELNTERQGANAAMKWFD